MTDRRPWIAVLVLAALPSFAAVPPERIHYQGVLRDAADAPLDGSFDMSFRFFDAETAGNEILVDTHAAAGTGTVTVAGGLFAVDLGAGAVADGSGPGSYTSLVSLFRDFADLWLEIDVAGETLAPRLRIAASPFAHNASRLGGLAASDFGQRASSNAWPARNTFTNAGNYFAGDGSGLTNVAAESAASADALDGLDSSQFLRSDGNTSFSGGTLTLAAGSTLAARGFVQANGDVRIDGDGPDGDQTIWFYEGNNSTGRYFRWDDLDNEFEIGDSLRVNGTIRIGGTSVPSYNHLGGFGGPDSGAMVGNGDLYVASNLELDGTAYLAGTLRMKDEGPDATQTIYFYDGGSGTGESIGWDDVNDRFSLSNDLWVNGRIEVTDNQIRINAPGPDGNSAIYFFENGSPTGAQFSWDDGQGRFDLNDDLIVRKSLEVVQDLSVGADLAVDANQTVGLTLRVAGEISTDWNSLRINRDGPEQSQSIYFYEGNSSTGRSLSWEDASGRFRLNDDLYLDGSLTAAGAKNFLQNHPHDPSLSIVYTALEGDEAGTYTRGSARLEGGEARIALGASFPLVTHPDLGLTAHLTPRTEGALLHVVSLTSDELVVRGDAATPADAAFDYLVLGLRIGYEQHPVVRPRTSDAPLPTPGMVAELIGGRPELAASAPRPRWSAMHRSVHGVDPGDRAAALAAAIGVRSPESDPAAAGDEGPTDATANREAARSESTAGMDAEPVAGAGGGCAVDPFSCFPSAASVRAGDLLALDPAGSGLLVPALAPGAGSVMGVAAAEPEAVGGVTLVRLAVAGIASVRVDAGFGPIRAGDLLAPSSVPGSAMRPPDGSAAAGFGRALEAAEPGVAEVRVLLSPR